MLTYRAAYLVGNGITAIIWLILFFMRKDLRKQQLFVGFLLAPLAPLTDFLWFYHDYWRPEYIISFRVGAAVLGLESLLFVFLFSGIATVLYEVVFRKRHLMGKQRTAMAISLVFLTLIIMATLILLGLNSIWASSLAILITTTIMLTIDRDLFKDAIYTGILMTFLTICFYTVWLTIYPEAIERFWVAEALSGIRLGKIPIEELVWFWAAGMGAGTLYEFWLNVEKYPLKSPKKQARQKK